MKTIVHSPPRGLLQKPSNFRRTLRNVRVIFSTGVSLAAIALLAFVFQISNLRSQVVTAQQPNYLQLKSQAEKLFAEGSYARAHELYATVS